MFQQLYFPANFIQVVSILVRAEGARENSRTRLGIEDVIDRRHRAIVKIRRRRPDTVQRRSLIAGTCNGLVFLPEPALVVIVPELAGDAVVAAPVRADLVQGHNPVWIGPILAISAVAAGTGLL